MAWAACTLALIVFTVLDLFGIGVTRVTGDMMRTFLLDLPQGRALLLVLGAAVAVAVAASLPRAAGGAGYLLAGALAGLLPPLFTGHAASASNHALAVYSLAFHVLGVSLWVGGLVALVTAAPHVRDRLPEIVGRYSGLALASFAVVGLSGAVNAWVRLGGVHLGSRYGALVVAKCAALAALAAMGWWHRRATIPALRDGTGARPFLRLGTVELLIMTATMALATGLSRTPPPENPPDTLDVVALNLGFPLPGRRVGPYLLDWWIDPLFFVLVLTGAALYGLGSRGYVTGRGGGARRGPPGSWSCYSPPRAGSPGTAWSCSARTPSSTSSSGCWHRSCCSTGRRSGWRSGRCAGRGGRSSPPRAKAGRCGCSPIRPSRRRCSRSPSTRGTCRRCSLRPSATTPCTRSRWPPSSSSAWRTSTGRRGR